jgi:methylmalonyl-CoA/ethylmalonyl-CoA epimerase
MSDCQERKREVCQHHSKEATVMYKRLTHIGIAVKNLEASAATFSRLFGIARGHVEEVPEQRVKVTFFSIGDGGIELLEATSPDSPIAKFLEKRGEGIHHLSFEVDDIEAELHRLKQEGFQLIDEQPRAGADGYRVAFLHPKSTNGVLIEISEKIRPARPA